MNPPRFTRIPLFIALLTAVGPELSAGAAAAPVIDQPHRVEPLTAVQIAQRNRGYGMFIHFGVNTFNELEWSDGKLPAESYRPTELDCDQWIRVAKEAGFRYVVLITKHHDGFCLWDSKFTTYDVASSPVPTDVVAAVAQACRKYGLELGLYYSLWDRNHPSHQDPDPTVYQRYMFKQLEELMTGYGPICELWLDGGWKKPNDAWNMPEIHRLVRGWQPGCAVSNNQTIHVPGKDTMIRRPWDMQEADPIRYWPVDMRLQDPNFVRWDDPQLYRWKEDAPGRLRRLPFEHTICISDRWNWFQKKAGTPVRGLDELEQLFFWGTHHDSTLIVNVPPDRRGRIREDEAQRVVALAERLGLRGGGALPTGPVNVLWNAKAEASSVLGPATPASHAIDTSLNSTWSAAGDDQAAALTITLAGPATLDQVVIHEAPVSRKLGDGFSHLHDFGIRAFAVDFLVGGTWQTHHTGAGISHALRIDLPLPVTANALRIRVSASEGGVRLAHVAAGSRQTRGLRPIYRPGN
jgi:alpha-L-fucosidase